MSILLYYRILVVKNRKKGCTYDHSESMKLYKTTQIWIQMYLYSIQVGQGSISFLYICNSSPSQVIKFIMKSIPHPSRSIFCGWFMIIRKDWKVQLRCEYFMQTVAVDNFIPKKPRSWFCLTGRDRQEQEKWVTWDIKNGAVLFSPDSKDIKLDSKILVKSRWNCINFSNCSSQGFTI